MGRPYIGANIGYSAGKSKTAAVFSDLTTRTPLLATGASDNSNGAIGGIQGGYNWQWGNWVGGIEATKIPSWSSVPISSGHRSPATRASSGKGWT